MLSFSVQTGHEAIHFGAVNGHSHVVELLIDKYTVSPNATTEVLFSACRTTTLQFSILCRTTLPPFCSQ